MSKKEIVGGNTFKYIGYDKRDKTVNWDNGQSKLIFMTSHTKWLLNEKGLGMAVGKNNDDCPRLRRKGQLYAVATECRGNPVKKAQKLAQKNPITLKPVGKSVLNGGNTFSFSRKMQNGAERYENKGKSVLVFYPRVNKWAMYEKGVGEAVGNAGEKCPILKRKGKIYATSTKCSNVQKPAKKHSKRKRVSEPKKPSRKSTKKTISKPVKSIKLTPVGKDIAGGNTFKFSGVKNNGVKRYSNGKSDLYFSKKNIMWTLVEKGAEPGIGKKRSTCPILSKKNKMYAFDASCVPWKSEMKSKDWWKKRQNKSKSLKNKKKSVSKKLKKKKSKKSKKQKKKKSVAKKSKKKKSVAKKSKKKKFVAKKLKKKKSVAKKSKKKKSVSRKKKAVKKAKKALKKSTNKKAVTKKPRKSKKSKKKPAVKKFSKKKKKFMKKKKPSNKKDKKISKKSKAQKKSKKKKFISKKKSRKSPSKKSKKKKPSNKSFITLKPIGKKAIVGGNKFTSAGVRKDGTKKYTNGKSELLFYPKPKKWALKEKGLGWAAGKKGQLCPTLSRKGKLYATSTKCLPKKKKPSNKKGKKRSKKSKAQKKSKKRKSKKKSRKSPGKISKNPAKKASKKGAKKSRKAVEKSKAQKKLKKSSKKSSKKKKTSKNKSPPNVPKIVKLKPVPKYQINGGNTFRFQKVRKDGILRYSNGKSKLILGPKERKWALKDQKGWAVGKQGDECPVLKRRGRPVAKLPCKKVSDKVLKTAKGIQIKGGNRFKYVKTWRNGVNEFRNPKGSRLTYEGKKQLWLLKDPVLGYANGGVNEMICPAFKKKGKIIAEFNDCKNKRIKSSKKSRKAKKAKRKTNKKKKIRRRSSITLKPKGKAAIKGGNRFKFARTRKDGVQMYSNGKSQLMFYPKDRKWALKERSGWAVGKNGDLCPKLSKKGKLYATSKQCLNASSKKKGKKSKRKASKKGKKKSKKSSFGRIIKLKTVGKKKIVGGNTFKLAGIRKSGVKQYSNGKSKLLFYPKNKKWALKEKSRGWAVGKPGATCPILSKKGKPYAFSTDCKSKKTSKKTKKAAKKRKASKKSKSKRKRSKKSKKRSKKSSFGRVVSLKPVGKKTIVGGNKFKAIKSGKKGVKKYSNGKSLLIFNPKSKKWALKEKSRGWAAGKPGALCPVLTKKGKPYAFLTGCKTKKTSKKAKKALKKRKVSKKSRKQSRKPSFGRIIKLKTVGKKSIVGGNKFKSAGTRKDGVKKYSNGKSQLLFYPKNKKWALKEKNRGWAVGKPGALCPVLNKKGKPYAFSTSCKTKKVSSKKSKRRPNKISYNQFKKFLEDLINRNRKDSNLLSSVYKLAEKNKKIFK